MNIFCNYKIITVRLRRKKLKMNMWNIRDNWISHSMPTFIITRRYSKLPPSIQTSPFSISNFYKIIT